MSSATIVCIASIDQQHLEMFPHKIQIQQNLSERIKDIRVDSCGPYLRICKEILQFFEEPGLQARLIFISMATLTSRIF
jgi:hypothetical protein